MTRRDPIIWRLLVTVWLVYCVHFSSNVVRENYLAMALAEHGTVRVDEYLGLHPDLFYIQGRGGYINNNPGASILGAVPYELARPVIAAIFALKPALASPKPPAQYEDPRPNRTRFMNEARRRGLDVKLGLAALAMQVGLMAPLGAAAALLIFLFFRARLGDDERAEREALWIALLYAFATPIFFRSAFLNQNAIIAHCVLGAYVAMVGIRRRPAGVGPGRGAIVGSGALLGLSLLCDYSAIPLILVFGLWALVEGWRTRGIGAAAANAAWFTLGAAGPIALLLLYQYAAFGNPIFPAQRYMPATEYSVRGWNGMSIPTLELLAGNLFDPRYGLFAFSPLLLLGLAAPFVRTDDRIATRGEILWAMAAFVALWLFSSANQFASLQWNTGVRYLVPAAPLLFIALVPLLIHLPPTVTWPLIGVTLAISWAVSMTRESVPIAFRMLIGDGPMLPMTIALRKMSTAYAGLQPGRIAPYVVFLATAIALAALWRGARVGPPPHAREA